MAKKPVDYVPAWREAVRVMVLQGVILDQIIAILEGLEFNEIIDTLFERADMPLIRNISPILEIKAELEKLRHLNTSLLNRWQKQNYCIGDVMRIYYPEDDISTLPAHWFAEA